ncbi:MULTISPECIES: oligogalacturonate-specific porin KdgM family protein [unclassified Brenneria]|uniref:oligogalacturonate-specific porin KdgM family protein n=1 Tax=unclassified Brenneria TaxID=2634434 RepID=UPI0029C55B76|nr:MULTISPECIES: oligogalacturonate-specific porin KdgM family protein [unclassified Brenneria]MDX5628235.1 oligogalacturonate-specific porin KdgM family protein [Brenneria sp. L3-3Z]MDX5695582.1 oligogalacturonate-specific porin KdgM family protein [Brenneria sp. L4-2C]
MKTSNKALIAASLSLVFVGQASADVVLRNVSMDYRHEYRLRDRTHYDKLTLATQLPNDFSFAVETKFKTGGSNVKDKAYKDPVLNAVEMTLAKKYQFGNWTISPLFQPEFNSTRTEWKFGVSPWYKINDSWSVGGLYRLELTDYAHDSECTKVGTVCTTNKHRTVNRVDGYLRYRNGDLTTTYKIIFQHGDENLFAKKKNNYEQELQFNYALGDKKEWSPYISFGDINRSSQSSERQLRLRAGVAYTFK